MTPADDLLRAAERVAAAADGPAVTVEQERDKTNRILAGLADAGVMSMPTPTALGGHGCAMLETARVVAAISAVSGSAGLICAMHFGQLFSLVGHGRGDRGDDFLSRAAAGQWLIASGTSEVGVGGDILRSVCLTEPREGRLRLTKQIGNVSYLDRAAGILVTSNHDDGRRPVQRLNRVVSFNEKQRAHERVRSTRGRYRC